MNTKKTVLTAAVALLLGNAVAGLEVQAALPTGTLLSFTAGYTYCIASNSKGKCIATDVTGTYFSMDTSADGTVQADEKTPFSPGPDGGVIIGVLQDTNGHTAHLGASHPGVGGIDAEWDFFGSAGMVFTTTAITQITAGLDAGKLDFSGWTVNWNTVAAIPMGGDTTNYPNDPTVATLVCNPVSCANGSTFTLSYNAHVPNGDPSNFGGVAYIISMSGTVVNGLPLAGNVGMGSVSQDTSSNAWTPSASDPNTAAGGGTANTSLTCTKVDETNAHGTWTLASDCSGGTYTPTGGYTGAASITYRVNDGVDDSATDGTVSVTVLGTGSNLPPNAVNDSATADMDTPTIIDVTINDTDSDGTVDDTTVLPASPSVEGGTVVDNNDGTVTYTPLSGFFGTDTFTYTVGDNGGGTSDPATVTVTVNTNVLASSDGTLTAGSSDAGGDGRVEDSANLPESDAAMDTVCIGDCFDFVIGSIGVGATVDVVLPLTADLPDNSLLRYRKYGPHDVNGSTVTGWYSFVSDGTDKIKTAVGTSDSPAQCPPPGDTDTNGITGYRDGLNAGDRCIQLTLTDGGPNDADGVEDGTISDPGGAGLFAPATAAPTGTSGGGCSVATTPVDPLARGDWWLLAGFLAWLGAVIHRRRA